MLGNNDEKIKICERKKKISNITWLRTGNGIPQGKKNVLGKKLSKDLKMGDIIKKVT